MVVTKKPKRPTISFDNDFDKKVEEAGNADNADDVGRFPLADKCVPHLPRTTAAKRYSWGGLEQ